MRCKRSCARHVRQADSDDPCPARDLVGMLDCDPARFELYRSRFPEHTAVATYGEEEFGKMIDETKPDVVIVAGRDDTHARYIVAALERDLDVITENRWSRRVRTPGVCWMWSG